MKDIIRLHHEDWDFNKLFGDLKSQGVKAARLQLPREWEEDEKLRMEKVEELLKASEEAGVNIQELVPHPKAEKSERRRPENGAPRLKPWGRKKPSFAKASEGYPPHYMEATSAEADSGIHPRVNPWFSAKADKFGPAAVISNGHLKLYLIIGCILAAMVVAGGIILSQRAFKEQREQLVSPVAAIPTPVATPTETPMPILDRSDLTVRILNGSGKRGAAGELAKYLEGLGYSVSLTGNTNVQTGSKLRLKSGSEIYREILAADLEPKLDLASGSDLPQLDVVGAEIIIGQTNKLTN